MIAPAPSGRSIWIRSFAALSWLTLALAAALFVSAGTLRWWEAWAYLGLFLAAALASTVHFLRHDPELVRSRIAVGPVAEPRRVQRVVQAVASVSFVGMFVVCGLDRRFGWSAVPPLASLASDAVVAAGFAVIFLVFRVNRHASTLVEVRSGQRVVATGPYRHVRHPMYAGGIVLFAATPPALGSLVALPVVLALAGALVVRLLDEERLLSAELPGYAAYCRDVPYRLVPRVW